jgi:DNA-binding winged helix-turn-helix (wHTH) protein
MPSPVLRFGDFTLYCSRYQLLRKGRELRVERKPMELLILLACREGELVNRAEIAERLWSSDVFVDTDHGINSAIRKLRHLLRDDAGDPTYIQTVPGMGYRFVAKIEHLGNDGSGTNGGEDRAVAGPPDSSDREIADTDGREPPAEVGHRIRWRLYALLLLSLVVLIAMGAVAYRFVRRPPPAEASPLAGKVKAEAFATVSICMSKLWEVRRCFGLRIIRLHR